MVRGIGYNRNSQRKSFGCCCNSFADNKKRALRCSGAKNDKGEAVDAQGTWTAVYVKQADGWKFRMLTAAVKPPEQK